MSTDAPKLSRQDFPEGTDPIWGKICGTLLPFLREARTWKEMMDFLDHVEDLCWQHSECSDSNLRDAEILAISSETCLRNCLVWLADRNLARGRKEHGVVRWQALETWDSKDPGYG